MVDVEDEVERAEHVLHPGNHLVVDQKLLQTLLDEQPFRRVLDQVVENAFVALLVLCTEVVFREMTPVAFIENVDDQRVDMFAAEIHEQFIVTTIEHLPLSTRPERRELDERFEHVKNENTVTIVEHCTTRLTERVGGDETVLVAAVGGCG